MQVQSQLLPIDRLWSVARAMFARMCDAVGDAAALAARSALDEEERRAIRAWLAPIAAFARKLVLIEAAALAREPELPPGRRHKPGGGRSGRTASFRLWPRPRPAPARIRSLGEPTTVAQIWRERARQALLRRLAEARANRAPAHVRLARRMEALERVIAKPAAAARRLARRLRRTPRLALELAAQRPPRSDRLDADACDDARRRAWSAAFALNDTS
jgi:hypothetical protein